jgi:hypothetical protein
MEEAKNFPTMIIPNGTDISVNEHGQLSIRTPGNLVIQNSGVYSIIESGSGSVRIDPDVKVEAVSVQAADSCFVAGTLTAWRVRARTITLERGAQANIMLQESESLELDRNARLVGNFASEKELYLTLGRFSRELQNLPSGVFTDSRTDVSIAPGNGGDRQVREVLEERFVAPDGEDEPTHEKRQEQSEVLSLVRVIIEREMARAGSDDGGRESLEKLVDLVRGKNLDELRGEYRYLISQVDSPSDELERAQEIIAKMVGDA